MPGGLLNLVSYGNQNVILNGNPSKTFFKCAYAKYTNFGLQKFRIDFTGSRDLRMTESSTFKFTVPRYGDLLMDTYLVITLPTIWSSLLPPTTLQCEWKPYEFKWIDNLGTQIIKKIRFIVGSQVIQEFTGDYLYNLVQRDFNGTKKHLYNRMTGNIPELNNPAYAFGRNGHYPNAWPTNTPNYETLGAEPSIRSRKLYIPINIWFTLASKMAFPLVSLQYNSLEIEIELRPVQELFVVRDVVNFVQTNSHPNPNRIGNYIRPDFNNKLYKFYRFLQPPPQTNPFSWYEIDKKDFYQNQSTNWAADIHLISTYGFLSDEEVNVFASKPQQYLIKETYQYKFNNVVGSNKVTLDSLSLVASWMWFFRRTDAFLRNEWSNYTNWPYKTLPNNVIDPNNNLIDPPIDPKDQIDTLFYNSVNVKIIKEDNNSISEFDIFNGMYTSKGYTNDKLPFYYNTDNPEIILFIKEINDDGKKIWAFTKKGLTFTEEHSYILNITETPNHHILYDEEDDIEYNIKIIENKSNKFSVLPIGLQIPNACCWPDSSGGILPNTIINPGSNPVIYPDPNTGCDVTPTEYKISGDFSPENTQDIMLTWGLLLDGKYRENTLDANIFNYVEKYVKSEGDSPNGLYCYNFCLHTNPLDFQPSGAMNLSKFKTIEFEFTTYSPPLDPRAQTFTVCDNDGNTIGVNKPVWRIYDYTYDLIIMEERYNILTFTSGNAALTYAR